MSNPSDGMFDGSRLLTPAEAGLYLGLSPSTLAKKRVLGVDSPAYVQSVRNGLVRYRMRDLVAWSEDRLKRSTSDGDAPQRRG